MSTPGEERWFIPAHTIKAWRLNEFVVDPCRVSVLIGTTGIDPDTFGRLYLTDRYDQAGA